MYWLFLKGGEPKQEAQQEGWQFLLLSPSTFDREDCFLLSELLATERSDTSVHTRVVFPFTGGGGPLQTCLPRSCPLQTARTRSACFTQNPNLADTLFEICNATGCVIPACFTVVQSVL